MPAMDGLHEQTEILCPHCSTRLPMRYEDSGTVVDCPKCHMPFRVPVPQPSTDANLPSVQAPPQTPGMPPGVRFQFQCKRCGSLLEGDSNQAGENGMCPTCGGVFMVPDFDPSSGLAIGSADPGADGENPTPMHAYACAGDKAPRIIRIDDQRLAIECSRCNTRSEITSNNCPQCGVPFTLEGQGRQVVQRGSGKGSYALVFGVVGLVFGFCATPFGLLLGGVAVVLGILSRQEGATHERGAAIAGIILGILAGALGMVYLANWL